MICVASLALFDHIQGQRRGCMTAIIGIQTFTSKRLARKVITVCDIAFITALSSAAVVIQLGVQTVSGRLSYIATDMWVKSMCV